MTQQVRVNIDLQVSEGSTQTVVRALNTEDVITKINDFVANVLMDEVEDAEVKKFGGGVHECYAHEDPNCAVCRESMPNSWPLGFYVADR